MATSSRNFPNNLPIALSSFIGRGREIVEIKRLLTTTRLVTLAGSGGSGKTRLAIWVAAELGGAFGDGAWLVELASLADPALVPQAVTSVLGIREQPGQPIIESLADHVSARDLLIVLDNCEHLVAACARLADFDAFNAINKEEAERAGVRYLDVTRVSRLARADTSRIANDGLHPSGKMYAEWAKLALPIVREALGSQ